jgi:hypothetical protein
MVSESLALTVTIVNAKLSVTDNLEYEPVRILLHEAIRGARDGEDVRRGQRGENAKCQGLDVAG